MSKAKFHLGLNLLIASFDLFGALWYPRIELRIKFLYLPAFSIYLSLAP